MSNDKDFPFSGTGTLKRIDRFTTSKAKSILTLIFETGGQYPQIIPVKVFGRLAERADAWKPGAVLRIEGHLGGREWNGKVFGEAVADFVEVLAAAPSAQQNLPVGSTPQGEIVDPDSVPF